MKKILVTGFEPFGEDTVNPSKEIVQALPEVLNDIRIHRMVLPVEFGRAAKLAIEEAERCRPDAIVCFGLARGRCAVTPERVAINVMDARIPDNAGFQPEDVRIDEKGENAYFSTLPIKEIRQALAREGLPGGLSNSAGTYVCNDLMYRMLAYVKGLAREIPCGFVHFPCTEEMSWPTGVFAMRLEDEIRAAEIILGEVGRKIQ